MQPKYRLNNRLRIADCGLRIEASRGVLAPGASERRNRRGAVAVEFAVVAPILLALVLGMMEIGRALEMKNLLNVAAREGARFASMDRDGMLEPNESANDKLIADVKTFLVANGIPYDDITVEINDYENPETNFDLDDPNNDLRLFTVQITVNWSSMSLRPVASGDDYPMVGQVVFRNGRATISE
jgi:Flp pilus assembly protein TadG